MHHFMLAYYGESQPSSEEERRAQMDAKKG